MKGFTSIVSRIRWIEGVKPACRKFTTTNGIVVIEECDILNPSVIDFGLVYDVGLFDRHSVLRRSLIYVDLHAGEWTRIYFDTLLDGRCRYHYYLVADNETDLSPDDMNYMLSYMME